MADNKVRMPSSMGGLVGYSEDFKSKVSFGPKIVIALIVFVILIELMLHSLG